MNSTLRHILFRLSWFLLALVGCAGPTQLPIDLDSEPQGTDRDQLRAAMAQERPVFFETDQGERFYGEVRSTYDDNFLLEKKDAFEGDAMTPMTDRMSYAYVEIARAVPIPEEGNSTQGFVLGTTVLVVAILALTFFVVTFPVPY